MARRQNGDFKMTDARAIAENYIALWNETDPKRRQALIEKGWAENAVYVDPMMQGRGHAEIDGLVAGVQERFPNFRFNLIGKPDGFGDHVRFSWSLGPDNIDAPIEGTDFAVIKGDRIEAVTGFLDKVPAA